MAESKLLGEWFWTDRWMGSSAFLLPMEPRGLYREMLTQAWRRGCRLPNDHESIRRATGCTLPEWNRCWSKIEKYWTVDGDSLVSETQLEVWAEALAKHESARERGSKGGKAKAQALAKLQAELEAKQQAQPLAETVLEAKPPSPSPIVCSEDLEHTRRASANGTAKRQPSLDLRAGDFVERYKGFYVKFRNGVHYVGKPTFDYAEAKLLVESYDDERLDLLAEVWLKTDHDFAENGTRTIAKFRSMASWCDERLKKAGM